MVQYFQDHAAFFGAITAIAIVSVWLWKTGRFSRK
jgi:hypothetical protein